MQYYVYNPGGLDRGPYTLEELQAKLTSRALDPTVRIRGSSGKDYRPLSQVLDSPSVLDPELGSSIRPFRGSPLSGWFISFAILDFIIAAVGLIIAFTGSSAEAPMGISLFGVGLTGGFLFLAVAKVLDYLAEGVFRLRNLEEYATPKA